MSAVNATCKELGGDVVALDSELLEALAEWKDVDETDEADAFDFVEHLPKIWAACWHMSRWSYFECLRTWTMFLVAINMFARASCITTYCPTYEDIQLPTDAERDPDGLPQWIDLGMRDRKHR